MNCFFERIIIIIFVVNCREYIYGEDVKDLILNLDHLSEEELLDLLDKVEKKYPVNSTEVYHKYENSSETISNGQSQTQKVVNEIHNHNYYYLLMSNGSIISLPSTGLSLLEGLKPALEISPSVNGLNPDLIFLSGNYPPIPISSGDGVFTCGDVSYGESTNFISPSYPELTSVLSSCGFLLKIQPGKTQVRVDFVNSILGSPVRGECGIEGPSLVIKGTAYPLGISKFCGVNDGQHFYIDIDHSQRSQYLEFLIQPSFTANDRSLSYRWGLWITQIDEGSSLSAPLGCFQYFVDSSGFISSFNFEEREYLNNQLSAKGGDFGLEKFGNNKNVPYHLSGSGKYCARDFLRIPDSRRKGYMDPASNDRYCGGNLNPVHGSNESETLIAPFYGPIYSIDVRTGSPKSFIKRHHGPGFRLSYSLTKDNCVVTDMTVVGKYGGS